MEVYISPPKKRIKKKRIVIIVIILSIIVYCFVFFKRNIDPIIVSVSEKKVEALANLAVAKAVDEINSQNLTYAELVNIIYDNDGNIKLISANPVKINQITQNISIKTYDYISKLGIDGIKISLGTLTGMPIFTERGPNMTFELLPVGSVKCELKSDFISAGINQTNHKIYVMVSSDVTVVIPGLKDKKITAKSIVLLAESIIIGKVPETYLNFNKMDEMLNLVP
ncbi:MAG TPA: sporulation protein YunB [Clostridia bacterium]